MVGLHYAKPSALRIFLDGSIKNFGNHARGDSPCSLNNPCYKQFGASEATISTKL